MINQTNQQTKEIQAVEAENKKKIDRNMTEELFKMNLLKSDELIKYANNFSEFIIEIKYPSDIFRDIYNQVLEIKNLNPKQV